MNKLLAGTNPFGTVAPPPGVDKFAGGQLAGVGFLINVLVKTLIAGAGIYAVFSLILAGYAFISAGGDSKQIEAAWGKIWQTILGIVVTAGAIVLAAILGILLFDDPFALLRFRIYGA